MSLRNGLSIEWKGLVKATAPATQAVTNTPAPNRLPNTSSGMSWSKIRFVEQDEVLLGLI